MRKNQKQLAAVTQRSLNSSISSIQIASGSELFGPALWNPEEMEQDESHWEESSDHSATVENVLSA